MKLFIKILLLLAVYTPVAVTYKSTVYKTGFHTYTIPKGITTITFEGIPSHSILNSTIFGLIIYAMNNSGRSQWW